MKKIATGIKDQLQREGVLTFVDEPDLPAGADARQLLLDRLFECEVVVVMFCKEFFTSESCRTEALLVAQNAPDGRFLYVPVFLYAKKEEVQELATEVWAARADAKALVSELVGHEGIKHKEAQQASGQPLTKTQTITRICAEIKKIFYGSRTGWFPVALTSFLRRSKPAAVVILNSFAVAVGVGAGCQLVQSVLMGSQVAACSGCVVAVAELPPHNCCSPQQLLDWVQQLSQQVAAQGGHAVVAASGAGALVAWCAQGWGACLAPSATGLPSLTFTGSRVLSVRSGSADPSALGICWQGVVGPNPTLLVKQGPKLHAVQLPRTPAGRLDAGTCSAAAASGLADILSDMGSEEGMLLLAASTGQYLSSTAEAVLLLNVDEPTATQLSSMAAGAGIVVLHWLHTLLLEPDSQLKLLCAAAAGSSSQSCSSTGGGGSSSSSSSSAALPAMGPCGFDSKALYELQQQLLQPDSALSLILSADLEPWLPAEPPPGMWRPEPGQSSSIVSGAAAGAAAAADVMLPIKLAAVRAYAAYALLAVAIKQRRPLVVGWLLAELSQRAGLAGGHCTAEAVLVAQQRVAWSGMLPDFQLPLLVLADRVGNAETIKELTAWSGRHQLPTSVDQEAARRARSQERSVWGTLGLSCVTDTPHASSAAADWQAVASAPNMLQAASLEELASVLGPEGDLSVAVLTGSPERVRGVLDSGGCSQQQLDEALEVAAMLGGKEMLLLLLDIGADPTARGAAAMTWAKQRQGEPQLLTALHDRLQASGSSSSSSSSSGVGNLAVAAWCLGLQHPLSGLRGPGTPPPKLQSLQQFVRDSPAPGQRTVANLLAQLQREWPELFAGQRPKPLGHCRLLAGLVELSHKLSRMVTRQNFLLALGVWSLSHTALLLLHNRFRQLTNESILDLRTEEYSQENVKQLLHTAGAQGRVQYMAISLLDLSACMWAYTFLLSGLLTMASAVVPFGFFKFFNLLPCLAVLFDAVENILTQHAADLPILC